MDKLELAQYGCFNLIQKLGNNFRKTAKDRLTYGYIETKLEQLEQYWTDYQSNHKALLAAPLEQRETIKYFVNGEYDAALSCYLETKNRMRDTLQSKKMPNDLPNELGTFLIRKADGKVTKAEPEQSDGNDTDDLLRMLEDDDKTKKKKKVKFSEKPAPEQRSSDDDDDFVYDESAVVKKLRVAKSVLMRKKPAARAAPEDTGDDSDATSGDATTVKKIFSIRKPSGTTAKSTPKGTPKSTPKGAPKPHVDTPRPPSKNVITALKKPGNSISQIKKVSESRPVTSTPIKLNANKTPQKSILKSALTDPKSGQSDSQPGAKSVSQPEAKPVSQPANKRISMPIRKVTVSLEDKPKKTESQTKETTKELDEIINEEEFLDEDEFDLDEDFADDSEAEAGRRALRRAGARQVLRAPERAGEDVLSDGDSPDDDSLYDDLSSSDSEDMEDWFTLDIRAERAPDYLPLLGAKAFELLLEEKVRVSARMQEVRQKLSSLSGGAQAAGRARRLRAAAAALRDLDDMLKAA